MAQWILQGTTVVMAGPFVLSSDGKKLATKATLSTAKVKLSKNDAVFANKACTKASSYSAHGFYRIFISTVDSGTPGRLTVSANDTKCLPVWEKFMVVKANPYNSIMAGTDNLEVETGGIVKNSAFSNLTFLMVGSSDHYTGKTGLTVAGHRSLNASTFAALTTGSTIDEVANGIYQVDLAAADVNGDVVTYKFSAAGADDTFVTIKTVLR